MLCSQVNRWKGNKARSFQTVPLLSKWDSSYLHHNKWSTLYKWSIIINLEGGVCKEFVKSECQIVMIKEIEGVIFSVVSGS